MNGSGELDRRFQWPDADWGTIDEIPLRRFGRLSRGRPDHGGLDARVHRGRCRGIPQENFWSCRALPDTEGFSHPVLDARADADPRRADIGAAEAAAYHD